MVEVSEAETESNPVLDPVDGDEPITGPSEVGEEAQSETLATPANIMSRGRRTPGPEEPLSYLRVWRIGDGERRGDFIGKLLTVIEGAALGTHILDFKWSDRNNQREVVLKVATSGAPMVKHALRKFIRDSKCRISWSVPFAERTVRKRDGEVPILGAGRLNYPNRFVSWNVRGYARNKVEICASLARMRATIVGLQETYVAEDGWQLRMPGFRVYSRPGTLHGETGYHGVALAISRRLVSFETGPYNRHWVCAKVLGVSQGDAWYVINVYRSRKRERARDFTDLIDYVNRIKGTEPDVRVVMMGDLNWEPTRLTPRILRPCNLVRVPFKGNDASFYGGAGSQRRWTAIDHFLVTGNVLRLLSKAKARR